MPNAKQLPKGDNKHIYQKRPTVFAITAGSPEFDGFPVRLGYPACPR